uniref:DUF4968 domain-containing protein n=1 Tax=Panagrellus redivivus TaxID=6233 RepID=A0A7E4VDG6_PANRE
MMRVVSIKGFVHQRFKVSFTLSTGAIHTVVIDHSNEKLTFKEDGFVKKFFVIPKNTFDEESVLLEVSARKNGQSVVVYNGYRYNVPSNIRNLKKSK